MDGEGLHFRKHDEHNGMHIDENILLKNPITKTMFTWLIKAGQIHSSCVNDHCVLHYILHLLVIGLLAGAAIL